jgi:hypothetical protein
MFPGSLDAAALSTPLRKTAGLMNFSTTPLGGLMSKREPQIIMKTGQRSTVIDLQRRGKFVTKSSGWDEDRIFLEGDKLEVAVKNGRWVLTHLPARSPPAAELIRHYFPDE